MRERVGGRWAVSLVGYLFWFPQSIIFVFATVPAFQNTDMVLLGIVISVAGYLATGAVLWCASVTIFRHRTSTPVPVVAVVIVGGLAWAVRSALIGGSLDLLGLESNAGLASRFVYGFFLGALIVPLMANALATYDQFRSARQALIKERVNEELATAREDAVTQTLRSGLLRQVQAAIESARINLDRLDLRGESVPPEVLEVLAKVSSDNIRQTSHDTWVQSQNISRIRLADLIALAASRGFYRVWIILAAAVSLLIPLARTLSQQSLLVMMFIGGYGAAIALVSNHFIRVYERWRGVLIAFSMFLLAASGAIAAFGPQLLSFPDRFPITASILIGVSAGILFPAASLLFAWQPASRQALDRLELALQESDIEAAQAVERERKVRQEIATMLHGSVSANFTAATMRMRHAIARGEADQAGEALQEARRVIDVDLTSWSPVLSRDLRAALAGVTDPWMGIVDIESVIDPELNCSGSEVRAVVDVVTEAITNAVRHGAATRISISVSQSASGINICVDSDGSQVTHNRPGLGSRLFDELSAGQWQLHAPGESHDTRLQVKLPRIPNPD